MNTTTNFLKLIETIFGTDDVQIINDYVYLKQRTNFLNILKFLGTNSIFLKIKTLKKETKKDLTEIYQKCYEIESEFKHKKEIFIKEIISSKKMLLKIEERELIDSNYLEKKLLTYIDPNQSAHLLLKNLTTKTLIDSLVESDHEKLLIETIRSGVFEK